MCPIVCRDRGAHESAGNAVGHQRFASLTSLFNRD